MQCSVVLPNQQEHGDIYNRGLTALMTKGAMLSTKTTPPRTLFCLEIAYIRSVVNTGVSRQRV